MIKSKRIAISYIEKLIIYTILLLVVILIILQTNFSILTIVPFTIIYFFSIIFLIILPYIKKGVAIKNTLTFAKNELVIDAIKLKKISTKNHYYNDRILYIINSKQQIVVIPFSNFIEVSKTNILVNKRRLWKIIATQNDKKMTIEFTPNYSIRNSNFLNFIKELKEENTTVKISKFNLWNI